jgi:hypothetical protein
MGIYAVFIWYSVRGPCFRTPVLPTTPYFGTPRDNQVYPQRSVLSFRKMATVCSRVFIRFSGMGRDWPNDIMYYLTGLISQDSTR